MIWTSFFTAAISGFVRELFLTTLTAKFAWFVLFTAMRTVPYIPEPSCLVMRRSRNRVYAEAGKWSHSSPQRSAPIGFLADAASPASEARFPKSLPLRAARASRESCGRARARLRALTRLSWRVVSGSASRTGSR